MRWYRCVKDKDIGDNYAAVGADDTAGIDHTAPIAGFIDKDKNHNIFKDCLPLYASLGFLTLNGYPRQNLDIQAKKNERRSMNGQRFLPN